MNTLVHADIFFFVTTVVVIILALLVSILIYYIIRIARSILSISETVRKESEHVAEEIATLRETLRDDSDRMKGFAGLVRKLIAGGVFIKKAARRATVKKSGKADKEDSE